MQQTKCFTVAIWIFLLASPVLAAPDADAQKANVLFKIAFEGRCAKDAFDGSTLDNTEGVSFTYRPADEPLAPESKWTIYSFFCDRFHNSGSAAFILKDSEGRFRVLSFALPSVLSNASPENPYDLMGFMTTDTLINGEFRIEDLTIFTTSYDSIGHFYTRYKFIYDSFHFVEDQQYEIKNGKLEIKPPSKEEDEEQE